MQTALKDVNYFPHSSNQTDLVLQEVIACYDNKEQAERILMDRLKESDHELGTYIAIFKFYFYKKDFGNAKHYAFETLDRAARRGGFSRDWESLSAALFHKHNAESPHRVYLYTLKGLAFIYLRLEMYDFSLSILSKLEELDPNDVVGGSVIRDVANRVCGIEDDE